MLIAIAFTLAACSFTVNVPTVKTGVTQTLDINEAPLDGVDVNKLDIEAGPCVLTISSGAQSLVEGTVQYNVNAWKPEIVRSDDSLTLKQTAEVQIASGQGTIRNVWDLKLGSSPMELSISTGASDSSFTFDGLSISRLSIADGASKTRVRFPTPNLVEMSSFTYKTGASEVEISDLANSNARQVSFEGGVGSYHLDFSGELKQDMQININSGISEVRLAFPSDAHVRVITSGEMKNVDVNGTWTVNGNVYEFGSTGPLISVDINMALGNLLLIQN
jgi:hypothetical protein